MWIISVIRLCECKFFCLSEWCFLLALVFLSSATSSWLFGFVIIILLYLIL